MPPRKKETLYAIIHRTEKTCSLCKITKPNACFGKDRANLDGMYSQCKECRIQKSARDYVRRKEIILRKGKEYRATDAGKIARRKEAERYKKTPQYKVHYALTNAVRDGKIVKPSHCSKCGAGGRIHGHHYDYRKPLEVVWVCTDCHIHIHKTESHLIIYP